jgi:uncharacterized protein YdhG (YjbR/CyaY superfamily)
MKTYATVDAYIKAFPIPAQKALRALRATIRKAAPDADELISYGMPAYKQHGVLVYFGAHTGHIGFYPTSTAIAAFTKDVARYTWSKGTVRFPLDRPIPHALVARMVRYRVKENELKATVRSSAGSRRR